MRIGIIISLLLLSNIGLSQSKSDEKALIDEGNKIYGGAGSFGLNWQKSPTLKFTVSNYNYNLSAKGGWFVIDQLAVGGQIGVSGAGTNTSVTFNSNFWNLSLGLFGRYYFLDSDNKFNLFNEFNAGLGVQYNNTNSRSDFYFLGYGVGPTFFVTSELSLDLSLNLNFQKFNGNWRNTAGGRIGAHFYF
jgi:hypothetical protein